MNKLIIAVASFLLMAMFQIDGPVIELELRNENNNAAMVNMVVTFNDEAGNLAGSCKSSADGRCVIVLTGELPENNTIRGSLDFGPSGVRSVILFADEKLEMVLLFNDFGQVIVPGHAVHPTMESFGGTPEILQAPQIEETPTAIPTTKFVVVEPIERSEATGENESVVFDVSEEAEPIVEVEIVATEDIGQEIVVESRDRNSAAIVTIMIVFFMLVIGVGIYLYKVQKKQESGDVS